MWDRKKKARPLPVEQPGPAADWLFVGDIDDAWRFAGGEGRCPPGATVLVLCPEMLTKSDQEELRRSS